MSSEDYRECTFFIPIRRDGNLSDGEPHETDAWEWLDEELFIRFDGGTQQKCIYLSIAGHVEFVEQREPDTD